MIYGHLSLFKYIKQNFAKINFHQMDNRSGVTCCCGSVSIEKGTNVVAIILCLIDIISTISMFAQQSIVGGMISMGYASACLLVIYAQIDRIPWLFVPCLILGVKFLFFGDILGSELNYPLGDAPPLASSLILPFEVVGRVAYMSYLLYSCVLKPHKSSEHDVFLRVYSPDACSINFMAFYALGIPVYAWLYSIIYRGYLAVKMVESGRSRPPV
ncbi:hypothetical protein GPALN_002996 [Globodera pallida]|nr:hypothetical protein GPALN_002996 [Globodera pallida]